MRVAIIGGGPAGLVTLKYILQTPEFLKTDHVEAILFEAEAAIGGTFRYRAYESAELVSSRQLTLFSDFRVSDDSDDFLSTESYCDYLTRYCDHFGLWPFIRLSTQVKCVQRNEKGGHQITFQPAGSDREDVWHCDAVAVCSGLHVTPNIPKLPGIERVSQAFHSSLFKGPAQFGVDTNVLILGAGETSMDLAYLAVTSPTKSVTLCHRNGWTNAPKAFPDPIKKGDIETWQEKIRRFGVMPPTDCGGASLFDTAYVHPWLESSGLLWDYYDFFTKASSWLITGTTAGLGQWVGELTKERHDMRKVIPNKSNKAMPYISAPYKPKVQTRGEWTRSQRLSLLPIDLKGRQIDLAPWPERIDEHGYVKFGETDRPESEGMKHVHLKPDVVVFATGYTQEFPFLAKDYPSPEDADIRRIWNTDQPDVGFIGFVRPNFGAIPPLTELQAQLWILNLTGQLPHPPPQDDTYRLKVDVDRRIQYGVDHDSYAYRLAQDINAAPSVFQVLRFGTKVFATWALGPNFNTKFRLVGPWKFDGAADIMRGELWHVISRRRGWFIWTWLTVVPICIFGSLSVLCFVLDACYTTALWVLHPATALLPAPLKKILPTQRQRLS